jgi:hypothetical protein
MRNLVNRIGESRDHPRVENQAFASGASFRRLRVIMRVCEVHVVEVQHTDEANPVKEGGRILLLEFVLCCHFSSLTLRRDVVGSELGRLLGCVLGLALGCKS